MKWWERIWFAVGGLMLIDPGLMTDLIGIVMLGLGFLYQWRIRKRAKSVVQACLSKRRRNMPVETGRDNN